MIRQMKRASRRLIGFSRLEFLTVVTVTAILTVITVPDFSDSADDARCEELELRLFQLRQAIDRYERDHNGKLPGHVAGHVQKADAAPVEHSSPEEAVRLQLTACSDITGNTSPHRSERFRFGPYLKASLPQSPVAGGRGGRLCDVRVAAQQSELRARSDTDAAWLYSTATGQIIANHPHYDTH